MPNIIANQDPIENNVFRFEVGGLPDLDPESGSLPFYTFFWEFGDGFYSTSPAPTHVYPAVQKNRDVKVTVNTNNTTDPGMSGGPLALTITVSELGGPGHFITPPEYSYMLEKDERGGMAVSCEPFEGADLVNVVCYRNPEGVPMSDGKIIIRYNELTEDVSPFTYVETREHFGETSTDVAANPSTGYKREVRIDFSGLSALSNRNLFVAFSVAANLTGHSSSAKMELSFWDTSGNPKGSSILVLPIVETLTPLIARIDETETVPAVP